MHRVEEMALANGGVEVVCVCGVIAVATMLQDESFNVQCWLDDEPAPDHIAAHGTWALVAYRHLGVALERVLDELLEQQSSMPAEWALAYMEAQL